MKKTDSQLGSKPLGRLMLTMAVPSVIAQLINLLYSIVDRIYIGHIPNAGADALTGIGLTFPITTFISAFSVFVGMGGAPLASIWLGKGDRVKAERILGSSAVLLAAFSVVLTVVFYIFRIPLLYAFGASESTISYASDYIQIYLIGTLFVELSLGLNSYITSQGKPKTAMLSILIGAVLNLLLDPLFIFVLGMGVSGAAYATVISQAASAMWVVGFLVSKKAALRLRLRHMRPDFIIIKNICTLGISPFIMRATESLVSVVLNHGLAKYGGDLYVGSLTIMNSVLMLFSAPLGGFTQGVQPIISYCYGARLFDRVKRTYRSMIAVCTAISFISTLTAMLFPGAFARLFTDDAALIAIVRQKMPMFLSGMLIFGLQAGIQPTFLALGQAKQSMFIAMLRKIILLIPLALILPLFFGADGIFIAEPISDTISALTATAIFTLSIKRVLTEEALEKIN